MPDLNAETNGVDPATQTAGGEVTSGQDQDSADSKNPRTERAPGRLPARAARTGNREAFRFHREL
jgi:hypothetical protein